MTYGTVIGVKERCGIEMDDTRYDQTINRALAYADGVIDTMFTAINKTVPTAVPQILKDAASDLAAYYMLRIKEPEKAQMYLEHGTTLVNQYIDAKYRKGTVIRGTTGQVYSESDSS